MNQRERIMAGAVGALAITMGGYYAYGQIHDGFAQRNETKERLETDIKKKQKQVNFGKQAQQRLEEYKARSLPPDPKLARQLYTDWLLKTVTEIGFIEPKVLPSSGNNLRSPNEAFKSETFGVSGAGSLEMLTRLLYAIHSVDYLHRIKALQVAPRDAKDSKTVAFGMTIETLSLPDAEERDELHLPPAHRLAEPNVEAYVAALCGRNMFGPPNIAPKLSLSGASGQTNREVTLSPTASDADEVDKLVYSWKSKDIADARFDPANGKFSWTPRKAGEYLVEIAVRDDGVPARTTQQQVKITVADPPPVVVAPPPKPVEQKPKYDQVQFTYVNGITEVDGQRQVWMIDRRSGKNYWLHEGDKFQVGAFSAQVKHIGPLDVELEWYNRGAVIPLGENLSEDKEMKDDEPVTARQLQDAS